MSIFISVCSILLITSLAAGETARNFTTDPHKYINEHPYCFRFTWVGPYLDKDNIGSLSCEGLIEDMNSIPCQKPITATFNDHVPDTVKLWDNMSSHGEYNGFGCPMIPGQSCVKYSYYYKGEVQNITYMCAKVNATNGCYRQKFISGSEVEACVCQSRKDQMPCNYATSTSFASQLMSLLMTIVIWLINKIS